MLWLKHNKKTILLICLIVAASVPAIWNVAQPGFFETDDGNWMIIRFSAFYQALRDGQFPVRYLLRLNNGYGYPVATFLYPGFMYVGIPLKVLGLGFETTVKVIISASVILSGIFSLIWLRNKFDSKSAFIGALFYVYTPYHLFDIYHRGSVGEVFALVWPPLILWAIDKKNVVVTALATAALILSHNTLALFFLPIVLIYAGFTKHGKGKTKGILTMLASIAIGIGLTSFFSLPALYELQFTKFSTVTISDPTNYFASADTLGISTIVATLTACLVFIFYKKLHKNKKLFFVFAFFAISTIILASPVSKSIWENIPSSFVQFPFRLLSITIICVAYLSAFAVNLPQKAIQKVLCAALAISLLFSALRYAQPIKRTNFADEFYSTNQATTTVKNEYMSIWTEEEPVTSASNRVEVIEGDALYSNTKVSNNSISFNTVSQEQSTIQVNVMYWPGWQAKIDGKEVNIQYKTTNGIITIPVEKGMHQIEIIFKETNFRKVANALSIGSFIALIALTFATYRLRKRGNVLNNKKK